MRKSNAAKQHTKLGDDAYTQTHTQTDTDTQTHTNTDTDTQRHTQTQTERTLVVKIMAIITP